MGRQLPVVMFLGAVMSVLKALGLKSIADFPLD